MADIKLDPQTGDLFIIQLTPDPIIVSTPEVPACDNVIQETDFDVLQEDDESTICTEDSETTDFIPASFQIIGDPAKFDVTEEEDDFTLRLKRAIKTPIGHLSMYYLSNENVEIVDALYGNAIYQELSEGLTLNFLARVKNHIGDSIRRAGLTTKVKDIDVGVLDSHTVQVFITYTDSINPTVIPISF